MTSVRLGAVRRRVQIWLCTEQRVYEREKMFGVISPPRDLLPLRIIIVIIFISTKHLTLTPAGEDVWY